VIVHDVPWMKTEPPPGPTGAARADRDLIDRLRAERFDAAVIFTVHSQSALPAALLCHLADIPLRLAHARENPYRLLTDWVPDPEPDAPIRHEVRRQLDLVGAVGAAVDDDHLSVRVPPVAARAVRARLDALGVGGDRPWAVLAPGASASSRRYPPASYRAVAATLARDHGWQVVVTGGRDETTLVAEVAGGLGRRVIPLAGELGVPELAALLAMAPVLIGNNSGPAHLAAAVGTPVVDVYALTNLQHAPWGVVSRVLATDVPCKGCRKSICPIGDQACIRGVDPRAVVAAALELVAPTPSVGRMPAGILAPNPRHPPSAGLGTRR
jgi:lipopolysaccharide heptosyltransferase II